MCKFLFVPWIILKCFVIFPNICGCFQIYFSYLFPLNSTLVQEYSQYNFSIFYLLGVGFLQQQIKSILVIVLCILLKNVYFLLLKEFHKCQVGIVVQFYYTILFTLVICFLNDVFRAFIFNVVFDIVNQVLLSCQSFFILSLQFFIFFCFFPSLR